MEAEPTGLEWVQLREDMANRNREESPRDKLVRKFKENPLVPIGCLATVAALSYGLYCFRIGDSRRSQTMMRLRVVAQSFTVVALVAGVFISTRNNYKKSQ